MRVSSTFSTPGWSCGQARRKAGLHWKVLSLVLEASSRSIILLRRPGYNGQKPVLLAGAAHQPAAPGTPKAVGASA